MKILSIIVLLFSLNVHAGNEVIESKIEFIASGRPAFIKAKGEMEIKTINLSLLDNMLSAEVDVDLNKLDSGISLRDSHLKEKYLEVDKHPIAKIIFKNIKIGEDNNKQNIKAKLILHGVEKDVNVIISIVNDSEILSVEASFDILLDEFNIELPSFQGITAASKVIINVETKVKL